MKNQKGFTLLEILIVSVFIIGVLIFLFTQFMNLKKSYDYTLTYNKVEGLYGAKQINMYLNDTSSVLDEILEHVDNNKFIDISNCSSSFLIYTDYCTELYNTLNVKTVIITKENLVDFKNELKNNNNYSEKLKQYLDKQRVEGYDNLYRLIVEYNDESYASIIMEVGHE